MLESRLDIHDAGFKCGEPMRRTQVPPDFRGVLNHAQFDTVGHDFFGGSAGVGNALRITALFQQALQGDDSSLGTQLVQAWLERLFRQGLDSLEAMGAASDQDRETLAINVIAMFNLTAGYFLSQRAFDCMAEGQLASADNIARQKALLRRVIRAMLVS